MLHDWYLSIIKAINKDLSLIDWYTLKSKTICFQLKYKNDWVCLFARPAWVPACCNNLNFWGADKCWPTTGRMATRLLVPCHVVCPITALPTANNPTTSCPPVRKTRETRSTGPTTIRPRFSRMINEFLVRMRISVIRADRNAITICMIRLGEVRLGQVRLG